MSKPGDGIRTWWPDDTPRALVDHMQKAIDRSMSEMAEQLNSGFFGLDRGDRPNTLDHLPASTWGRRLTRSGAFVPDLGWLTTTLRHDAERWAKPRLRRVLERRIRDLAWWLEMEMED